MVDLADPIYTDKNKARKHLESIRWPDGPECPHCGAYENITKLKGKSTRPGVYKCNACRKPFSVTVGTVFERSKIPLHNWVLATHLLAASKKGMSAHQLHRMLGVTYKTAWFMAHRIRAAMKDSNPGPLGGFRKMVEADETLFGPRGYEFSNDDGWQRKGGQGDKYRILSLVERGGEARSFHVKDVTSKTIRNVLVANVDRQSTLMTDEAKTYKRVGKEFRRHRRVNHSRKEWSRGLTASTNTIEGYFSLFKRGMNGIYQHCGEKHLQRYLDEFDFRYTHRKVDDHTRAEFALSQIEGKRLTYRRPRSWF